MRVFFCKYNDPPYVKREKLDVMVKLASDKNIDQVISELKEYAKRMITYLTQKDTPTKWMLTLSVDRFAQLDDVPSKLTWLPNDVSLLC